MILSSKSIFEIIVMPQINTIPRMLCVRFLLMVIPIHNAKNHATDEFKRSRSCLENGNSVPLHLAVVCSDIYWREGRGRNAN